MSPAGIGALAGVCLVWGFILGWGWGEREERGSWRDAVAAVVYGGMFACTFGFVPGAIVGHLVGAYA